MINFSKNKNKVYLGLFILVLGLGIFFRTYKFKEYLFFEIDQARDWQIIKIATTKGITELPLLGPLAGGTNFRLGPAIYYFQYLSACFFGTKPYQIAYLELVFAIATIPLFLLFVREYFKPRLALALTALFAFSLFAIEYSRFSWNPNAIPFFALLIFYAFLRLLREDVYRKKLLWVMLVALGLGIIIQLHTFTLVTFPVILLILFFFNRSKICSSLHWKHWFILGFTFFAMISPVLVNELVFNFRNSRQFLTGVSDRQKDHQEFNFQKKVVKNLQEFSRHYALIVSSKEIVKPFDQPSRKEGLIAMLKRNWNGRENKLNLIFSAAAVIVFFASFTLLIKLFKTTSALAKRNFLQLILVWQTVTLIVMLPLAFNQDTRFYLSVIFIPYVFLGFWLQRFWKAGIVLKFLGWAIIIFLGIINLIQIKTWFALVKSYQENNAPASREYILEHYFSVTFSQMEGISTYIANSSRDEDQTKKVFVASSEYFYRSVKYLLLYNYELPVHKIKKSSQDQEAVYFFFDQWDQGKTKDETLPEKYQERFEILEIRQFGNILVFKMSLKSSQ